MKSVLRVTALAAAVLGVAACVQQVWQVTYPGPDQYSFTNSLLVADDGTAYMAGYLDQQSIFVAAYNRSGELLWDRVIGGNGRFAARVLERTLAQDADGNLYLHWPDLDANASRLYKLDQSGNLLLDRELENSAFATDLKVGPDGNLYLTSAYGLLLNAYTPAGDLLWAPADADLPEPDLEDYPGIQAASASAVATSGYSVYSVAQLVFVVDRTFYSRAERIVELGATGAVLGEVAAAYLGLQRILRTVATVDGLLVAGYQNGVTELLVLNPELAVVSRQELAAGKEAGVALSANGSLACVALLGSFESAGATTQLFQVDLSGGVHWQQNLVAEGKGWQYADVLAADTCYFSVQEWNLDGSLNVKTRRYDSKGKATDTIDIPDFGWGGFAVQGKEIYHVGITGEYDGSVTQATLTKHRHY
ncbi:MAG: hypothetical protein HPY82_08275 [Gammaproteobacteria bacterium]|nr:hypothetical protein [Gammaproteobacteria bacterium]